MKEKLKCEDLRQPVVDAASTCVVCYCDAAVASAVDCASYLLPLSGKNLKETLLEWRRKRRAGGSGLLDRDGPLLICRWCLELVGDIDRMELLIEKRFDTLWFLMDLQEPFEGLCDPLISVETEPTPKLVGKRKMKQDVDEHSSSSGSKRLMENGTSTRKRVKYNDEGVLDENDDMEEAVDPPSYLELGWDVSADSDGFPVDEDSEDDDAEEEEYSEKPKRSKASKTNDSRSFSGGPKKKRGRPPGKKNGSSSKKENHFSNSPYTGKRAFLKRSDDVIGADVWFLKTCRICNFTSDSSVLDIEDHHSRAHPGISPFVCHFCFAGFDCVEKFFAHVLRDELGLRKAAYFTCEICGEDVKNPRRFEKHIGENHPGGTAFTCVECGGLSFQTFKEFVEHRRLPMATHVADQNLCQIDEKDFKCVGCDQEFSSWFFLLRHLVRVEFNKGRNCDDCGLRFASTDKTKEHCAEVHGVQDKIFECDECGKQFHTASKLSKHRSNNHKQDLCTLCGKVIGADSMRVHLNAVHGLGDAKFHCPYCPEKFHYRFTRTKHLAKAHKIRSEQFEFPCSVCGKNFSGRQELMKHQFVQHGIRDEKLKVNKCTTCGKELVGKAVFDQHLLTHTGEKPHACPHCDHRVAVFHNLLSHIRQTHNRRVRRVFLSRDNRMNYIIVDESVTDEEAKRIAESRGLVL